MKLNNRSERGEEVQQREILRKSVPDRGNTHCKGSEVESQVCSRKSLKSVWLELSDQGRK